MFAQPIHVFFIFYLSKPNPSAGIIPRAIVHVFEGKEADEDSDTVYDIRVSYIEIYNEEIRYRQPSI